MTNNPNLKQIHTNSYRITVSHKRVADKRYGSQVRPGSFGGNSASSLNRQATHMEREKKSKGLRVSSPLPDTGSSQRGGCPQTSETLYKLRISTQLPELSLLKRTDSVKLDEKLKIKATTKRK